MKTFLGVPLWICALFALAFTVVWAFIWPKDRSVAGFRYLALRWFHALTWLLLSLAALTAMLDRPWSSTAARILALSSLAVYLVFLAVTVTTRRS